jgi:glycosyltransferase involved in cell wall biosynthesis
MELATAEKIVPLDPGVKLLLLPELAVKLTLGALVRKKDNVMAITFEDETILLDEADFDLAARAAKKLKVKNPNLKELSAGKLIGMVGWAKKYISEELFLPGVTRVLYWQAPEKGSAFWRALAPAMAVNAGTRALAHLVSPRRSAREALEYDVVVFQLGYDRMTQQYARILQGMGKKIVFDFDDDYFSSKPWHGAHEAFQSEEARENLKAMIALADVVTVTTAYLKEKYQPYAKRVEILPNYIPLAVWPKSESNSTNEFRVLWAGSPSHFGDLHEVADALVSFAKRQKNIRLIFFGREPVGLEEVRDQVVCLPWCEMEEYPIKLAEVKADIAIAPLADMEFNLAKSNIKVLEYAACGYPIIASDVGPYHDTIDNGVDGFLCKNAEEWSKALAALLHSTDLRDKFRERATQMVRKYDIDRHRLEIENFFSSLRGG